MKLGKYDIPNDAIYFLAAIAAGHSFMVILKIAG